MKRFTSLLFTFLLLFVFSGFLYSCGKDNDDDNGGNEQKEKVTLTVWGAENDQALLKEMCNEFAKANPDKEYKFLFGVQGEGDAADKVLNDVTSGPDVFSFASDQINKLIAGGALARIGGANLEAVRSRDVEGAVDAATITVNGEDQLYAYPMTGDNNYFVYYDKRVYKDPSQLASLEAMLDTANAAGKKVHFKLNDDGWYLSSFFFTNPDLGYKVTYNQNMVEEKVEINYDTEAGLDVMKSLRTYLSHDALVANTDDSKIIAAFTPDASGKVEAAAAISGTWNAETVKQLLGENMGVCVLPKITVKGEQVQLSGYMGYKLIGVNGYSQNKVEAHKLALWLTNEQNQLKRFETRGFGPTNKVVSAMEKVQNDPVISVVLEQAQYNRAQKGVPGNYWTPMGSLITPIITAKDEGVVVTDEELMELLIATCKSIRKE